MLGMGQNTGKTVAVILGGAAGVGFVVMFLLFIRGLKKKHDGMHQNMSLIQFCAVFARKTSIDSLTSSSICRLLIQGKE